jgi:CRISPR-associated protein Cas5h
MKVIGFNLSGKYALFTKPYTKNQPQSFIIPPKTAICGMIGGILGFKREEYQEKLKSLKYSVVLKKATKYTTRFNLLQGKNTKFTYKENSLRNPPNDRTPRSPTTFEILKNPSWDVFISLEDNLLYELQERIKKNLYVYEPYLGVANAFAKLTLFEEITELKRGVEKIKSFFEMDLVKIKLLSPVKFYNELIPVEFSKNRTFPITKEMIIILGDFEIINKSEIENEFFRYKDYSLRFI